MPATSTLPQDVLPVGFVDELIFDVPMNLRSNTDFPPLNGSTMDDWDCIGAQDADDICVSEDAEEWQQLELAIQRSLEPEYCFAAVAKQAKHVPAPHPRLIPNNMVFDSPIKRRQKSKEQDEYLIEEESEESLTDLYPHNKVASKMREMATIQKRRVRRNLDCHVCLSIIPAKQPQEPVITLPLFHSRYSYSAPLTFHQYQHALFKLLQIHERGLSAARTLKTLSHAENRKSRPARRLEMHEPLVDVI
ncbi:hypothetical protein VKS41_002935 [Umbelopsis sp. WA50703]